jgi:GAF domain-containing protein
MATGEPIYGYEHGIEKPDCERVWLSINMGPVRDDEGDIEYLVSSIEDVTERVERERRLERVTERLRTLKRVNRRLVRATDPEATVAEVVEIIHDHPDIECAFLAVLDRGAVGFAHGSGSELSQVEIERFHTDTYVQAVFDAEVLKIAEVSTEPYRQHRGEEPRHAGVALPLQHGERPLGVLTVHHTPTREPTDEEIDLLEEVADDIALVLNSLELKAEGDRLTADLRRSIKQLQVLDHVLRHNFNNAMNVIQGYAGMIRDRSEGEVAEIARTILEESEALL